jgi:hypothetical protein
MRMLIAFLIVLGAVYIWDVKYNNRALTDGGTRMMRDIEHSWR